MSDKNLNNADKWCNLLSFYKTEMSMREIAECLHVSLTSLYSKVKELGLKRKPRYKKKPIDINLFKELLMLGAPDVNIAGKLGVCTDTVIKLKKKYGFTTQDKQRISKGKKGSACRMHYKKTGTKPVCPTETNILEKYSDDIIQLLKNGTSKAEIARLYGVCYQTVYNFINLYGLSAPVKKICNNQEPLIKEAFAAGESLEDISGKLKCHTGTVYNAVKSMKLTRDKSSIKRKSVLNNQEEKIRQLYEQGVSGTEIARQLGVSYPCLYEFIHRKKFAQRPLKRSSVFDGHDEELMKMRDDKMTLEQIGEYFGVGRNAVWYRIRKLQSQNNEYQNI